MFISVTIHILSFRTLPFIPQKKSHRIFCKLPVDNFPHSAKYPFTSLKHDTAVQTAATMQYADLDYECAVYRYQKNIAVLKVAVLYTMGLLNQWY